ncbi:hypothetical protein HZH68_008766 [Vespula germanica]|uniref:Uncharacterized protein n=1 Tax=Vespula germanica TaxID=30212 RepID=A0A834K2Z9_VESGE|nr:hypothetical protein HZH68_008766 [Vespula germanica]
MKSKEEVRGKRIRWVLRRVERKKGYKKEERKKEKKEEEEEKEEVVVVEEEGDEEDEKESLVTPFYEALLETKRNETKRNETKRNETKRKCFVRVDCAGIVPANADEDANAK